MTVPPTPAPPSDDAAAFDAMFGRGPDGAPAWLRTASFEADAFDAEAYIADAKKLVPLDTLAAELKAYAEKLKAKLVQVLNDDYDDFIALSSDLADVDAAVAAARVPLRRVQRALAGATAAVDAARSDLAAALADRDAAAAARRRLESVRDAAAAADRVDALLEAAGVEVVDENENENDDGAPTPPPAGTPLDDATRALERAAVEVARLRTATTGGRDAPVLAALAPRARAAARALARALEGALAAALDAGDDAAAVHVLQSFAALGDGGRGARAARRAAFDGPLTEALSTRPEGPGGVPAALSAALDAIDAHAGGVLRRAADPAAGLGGLPLLPAAVAAAADALAAAAPAALSPGRPDDFAAAYRGAAAFVAGLDERYGGGGESGGGVPSAAAAAAADDGLLTKFPLPAYAALKAQAAASALEAALADPGARAGEGATPAGLRLAASAGAAAALAAAADAGAVLPPVADRFLRLALQAASRYATWVGEGAGERAAAEDAATGDDDAAGAPPTQTEAATTPPTSTHWAATASVDALVAAAADATCLAGWARSAWGASFAAAAGATTSPAAAAAATAGAARVGAKFDAAAAAALTAAAAALAARAAPALRHLRGVVATYRMTARPPPTAASPYAAACLDGVVAAVAAAKAAGLGDAGANTLATLAVSRIAARFAAVAGDVLGALRRTESSLRRLKGPTEGGGPGAGGSDVAARVGAQVVLDARAFGEAASKLGVDVRGDAGFGELWAVAAGERVAFDGGSGGVVAAAPPPVAPPPPQQQQPDGGV